jgi:23S rRNA (guanosine2251-2'-O)-methyltransferase
MKKYKDLKSKNNSSRGRGKNASVQQSHIRGSRGGEKRSLLKVNEHFRPTDNKVDGTAERLRKNSSFKRGNHPATHSSHHDIVIGKNAVREVLRYRSDSVEKVYIYQGNRNRSSAGESGNKGKQHESHIKTDFFKEILELIEVRQSDTSSVNKKISLHEVDNFDTLSELCGTDSHQGVVLLAKKTVQEDFRTFLEAVSQKENSVVLALDSINDPQNLGAILRTAECFGVDGVIFSENRGSSITPVVSKTSAGAAHLVPIFKVSNLAQALEKLKTQGGCWVVTADAGTEHSEELHTFSFPKKSVLVLGSEGNGVQELIKKKSDFKVYIKMFGKIDSLNVAQASAVFLYHYRSRTL